jgi:dienelactone hydrolase
MNRFILMATLALSPLAFAKIQTKTVEYKEGNTVLEGYYAYDDAIKGRRPGVLIVHEWTGVGPYVKKRAEMLAKMGYTAFAADIYGKGVRPQNPKEAATQAGNYKANRKLLRARAQAGLEQLRRFPQTDTKQVAAIGYCFGGTTVLELARSGADLTAVVSFHGALDTPNLADAKNIKAKILACHGGDDPYVPMDQVLTFEKEMRDAKVDWQLVVYGNAVHSFTNPESGNDNSKGAAYNENADKRSWQAMTDFFDTVFNKRS